MIIVPELQKIFILVPRTGTGTLYRELMRVYPKAMLLYRHMEADGVPQGYDRWERVGFVRHPVRRLWSLYNFMQTFAGGAQVQGGAASADAARIHRQVAGRSFEDWVLNNVEPWTVPYDLNGEGAYWPVLERKRAAPETRLSQWSYLRPDFGTRVLKFENLPYHMADWGLDSRVRKNDAHTQGTWIPATPAVEAHVAKFCAWDLQQGCVK